MRLLVCIILFNCFARLEAQTSVTKGEIYDFEIGDVFHFKEEFGVQLQTTGVYYERFTITDKYYNQDSSYVFYEKTGTIFESIPNTSISSFVNTIGYALNDSIFGIDTVYSDNAEFNGHTVYLDDEWGFDSGYDNVYIVGCGAEYHDFDPHMSSHSIDLVYFKKGTEEWGSRIIAGLDDIDKRMEISFYPNPVKDQIHLSNYGPAYLEAEISIYSVNGTIVLKSLPVDIINVSDLKSGTYLLRIVSESHKLNKSMTFIKE